MKPLTPAPDGRTRTCSKEYIYSIYSSSSIPCGVFLFILAISVTIYVKMYFIFVTSEPTWGVTRTGEVAKQLSKARMLPFVFSSTNCHHNYGRIFQGSPELISRYAAVAQPFCIFVGLDRHTWAFQLDKLSRGRKAPVRSRTRSLEIRAIALTVPVAGGEKRGAGNILLNLPCYCR